LVAHPEFLTYLNGLGQGITFMKSASYLLHGSNFTASTVQCRAVRPKASKVPPGRNGWIRP
jgi:hypothetical protein